MHSWGWVNTGLSVLVLVAAAVVLSLHERSVRRRATNLAETCEFGVVLTNETTVDGECDDGNVCTRDFNYQINGEILDPAECVHLPAPATTACTNSCYIDHPTTKCDGYSGTCVSDPRYCRGSQCAFGTECGDIIPYHTDLYLSLDANFDFGDMESFTRCYFGVCVHHLILLAYSTQKFYPVGVKPLGDPQLAQWMPDCLDYVPAEDLALYDGCLTCRRELVDPELVSYQANQSGYVPNPYGNNLRPVQIGIYSIFFKCSEDALVQAQMAAFMGTEANHIVQYSKKKKRGDDDDETAVVPRPFSVFEVSPGFREDILGAYGKIQARVAKKNKERASGI
jgi:hypothetical protein